jgi:hypothetical protein
MNIRSSFQVILGIAIVGGLLSTPLIADENPVAPTTKPSEADATRKMMELAKPGEPHKLLAQMAGTWDYKMKMSVAPGQPMLDLGAGTAVRTSLMDGRYFSMDVNGKMSMPGPDGKLAESEFKGMSIEGYDNVKQKYVSSWIDNMGTGIEPSEGTYDPATKSFTYMYSMEVMPGVKTKARQVIHVLDPDHLQMDWYEVQGSKEVHSLEIDYTRRK